MVLGAIVRRCYGVASVILATQVSGANVSCAMVGGCSGEFCYGELCGEWVDLGHRNWNCKSEV